MEDLNIFHIVGFMQYMGYADQNLKLYAVAIFL